MLRFAPVLLVVLGSQVQAQIRISPNSEIFETYSDCVAVTGVQIDRKALEERGWQEAKVWDEDGTFAAGGNVLFSHPVNSTLVRLSPNDATGTCVVSANLASVEQFDELKTHYGEQFLAPGQDRQFIFMAEERTAELALIGSEEKPRIRLTVMALTEKKK